MTRVTNRVGIESHTRKVIEALLTECRQPARLLELYYWSKEPDLLQIIRRIALMPAETRRTALATFARSEMQPLAKRRRDSR